MAISSELEAFVAIGAARADTMICFTSVGWYCGCRGQSRKDHIVLKSRVFRHKLVLSYFGTVAVEELWLSRKLSQAFLMNYLLENVAGRARVLLNLDLHLIEGATLTIEHLKELLLFLL